METLAHLGPKLWSIVPIEIKETTSLKEFKRKIKNWKPNKCPCKLCRSYIKDLGYRWRIQDFLRAGD